MQLATSALCQKRTLALHFNYGIVLIHDHYAEHLERYRANCFAPVPSLALHILCIARLHNVIRLPFYLRSPFTGKH